MTAYVPSEDLPGQCELPHPEQWVECYGDVLFRYAMSRLGRQHDAEDVVQETLLAALRSRQEFRRQSQPQSWLLGICRHKVLTRLRTAARKGPTTDVDDLDLWFDASGHWRKPTTRWSDPAALVERQDFWRQVHSCLGRLPTRMAEAFTLRTLDDCDPADVCRELAISPANFWVLLHRARLRLVRCLQVHWFDAEDKPC